MVPGPTLPYCLSPPKERPLFMLPNSHTHFPATGARVKYGKKCPGPSWGSNALPLSGLVSYGPWRDPVPRGAAEFSQPRAP